MRYVSSRQTDKETGQNKTREYLTRRMVKRVEKLTAQSHPLTGRREILSGSGESAGAITLFHSMGLVVVNS